MSSDRLAAPATVAQLAQILDHAAAVAGLADRAERACSAARHVTIDAEAYGVICAILPLRLMPLQSRIAATMRAAAADLRGRSEALQAAALTYEGTDLAVSTRTATVADGRPE
ncbi:type VII secretion target [Catellatospora sp. KI3]|uniref:type VII secretion target n=1 Tax=Catellatospora sp. KI3 TaxID=3041620 RepID=UPI002482FF26|nr:type VII secretion target [Catellatospora sp. KI3]MDI1460615.1 type VII secretion target [Catellatospora sp. KI3]